MGALRVLDRKSQIYHKSKYILPQRTPSTRAYAPGSWESCKWGIQTKTRACTSSLSGVKELLEKVEAALFFTSHAKSTFMGYWWGCIRGSYPSTEEKQEIYNCYACYDIPEKGGINLFFGFVTRKVLQSVSMLHSIPRILWGESNE